MILSKDYEIIDITGEVLAIPVGSKAEISKDIFSFSNAAAFLLKELKEHRSEQQLVDCLVEQYDVDRQTAIMDVKRFISSIVEIGLIET